MNYSYIAREYISDYTESSEGVLGNCIYVGLDVEPWRIIVAQVGDDERLVAQRKREALSAIYEAINAPVLATDAVLAGLPKDANAVLIDDIGIPHSLDWVSRAVIGDGWAWGDDYDVMPYHKIQAFRCHKTAEYFRQFTLDGVRRVG
jgi:hypothetical protein